MNDDTDQHPVVSRRSALALLVSAALEEMSTWTSEVDQAIVRLLD
jgi:hypothetical protein